jgi:DNA-binding IclR family transcriptional regulator
LNHPSLTSNTVPLYATASGKAWLATLKSDDIVQKIVKNGGFKDADRYGPNVQRSIESLLRDVKKTAQRGYGIANSEAEPGVTAIAAAICSGGDGAALGTVSVAGPSVRMTDARIQELAPLVRQCAAELASLWPLRGSSGSNLATAMSLLPRNRGTVRPATSVSTG